MTSALSYIKKGFDHVKNHKYFWTIVIFLVWLLFFDQNNILFRSVPDYFQSKSLEKEKKFYLDKIHEDSIMLNELKTNDENLIKFAREQYYMKADDEDVFIIREK